jgi:hypothetical protein
VCVCARAFVCSRVCVCAPMHAYVYVLFVLQSVFKILFYIPYCRYIMAKEVNLQRAHIDTSVFLNQYQIALHTNEGKFSDNWFSVQLALSVL